MELTTSAGTMTSSGAIRFITLDTGARGNALNSQSMDGLTQLLAHVEKDSSARVLVLRSKPDRSFVAGADINELVRLTPETATVFISKLHQLCAAIRGFRVPVIAQLTGWCLGAGLEVAASCDVRLAARDAMFGMPEIKLGVPSIIHAALLPRLIGRARAGWMVLTGEAVDAVVAQSWSLVDQLHERQALPGAVLQLAEQLAGYGPEVVSQQRRLLREWDGAALESDIRAGISEFAAAYRTDEPRSFMTTFLSERDALKQGA